MQEVRDILGEPRGSEGRNILGFSSGEAVWKDEKTTITVHFLNDKVVSKRMSKTENNGSSKKTDREDRPEAWVGLSASVGCLCGDHDRSCSVSDLTGVVRWD